ncbi:MAG: GDP-mannose 4,6-dehydratase [Candidatus Micrarchaeota archaeon]
MQELSQFFKGKKILITGHTGFKGAWLSRILSNFGAQIFGYSLAPNTEPNLYTILEIRKALAGEKIADIRNYQTLHDFVQKCEPEIIFHLAAQPLVRESYDDPLYTFEANVMGSANILEAARHCPSIKSVAIVTTDKVYEDKLSPGATSAKTGATHPFSPQAVSSPIAAYMESDRLGGHDPYSSSKACAEIVVDSYRKSFLNRKTTPNCPLVASARAGNVIGGGDWSKDRLVPDIIRAKELKKTLAMRNPQAIRPWQHVLDPLFGYLLLAKGLYEGNESLACAYNFAPGEENFITVSELVEKSGAKYDIIPDDLKHEAQILKLDASKAKKELGWGPKIGMEKCLQWTFEWYEKFYSGQNMRAYTDEQIEKYLSIQ